MLLRNLCVTDGLCNGTWLIVQTINIRILFTELLTGDKKGTIVHIPRITTDTSGSTDMPFLLKQLQFPVRLAFAMTINKLQGQSFDRVGLIVQKKDTLFSHGKFIKSIVFEEALKYAQTLYASIYYI